MRPLSLAVCVLLSIVLVRAFTLGLADLIDPTESRYAFVAQEMVLSGDWVTPKLPLPEGIQPYLGKPPLHFWQTAALMSLFGMDAWVARVPSFIAWLLIGGCAWLFTRTFYNEKTAVTAAAITLTSGLLFFLAGSSTIDVTFSAWISCALTAFGLCAHAGKVPSRRRSVSGYGFFIFTALAFLTKGPAALILIGLALFCWLCARDARASFPALPWLGGTVIALLMVTPWFLIAERHNEGFLYYFFVQENFLRFVSRNYGDRFGTGHVYPRGSAIWMMLVAFLPWTPVLLGLIGFSGEARQKLRNSSPWIRYALFWGIAPAIFFSFARQLHAAYLIPGAAGLGITLAVLMEEVHWPTSEKILKYLQVTLLMIAAGAIPVSLFFHAGAFAVVAAVLLLALSLRYLRNSTSESPLSNKLLLFALSAATLYGVIFVLFFEHAGRIKSGRNILSKLANSLNDEQQKAVFLSHNTYSFYYYARDWQHQLGAPVATGYETLEQVTARPPAHLLLNKADIARIPYDLKERYTEAADLGKWKWWRRRSADEQPR